MADVLINPLVKTRLHMFIANPTHALLLSGQVGMGHYIAGQYVLDALQGTIKSVVTRLTPTEKQHITIEQVRELRGHLKLRNTQNGGITRIIVIDSIDQMLEEAQNALLKMQSAPQAEILVDELKHPKFGPPPTLCRRPMCPKANQSRR